MKSEQGIPVRPQRLLFKVGKLMEGRAEGHFAIIALVIVTLVWMAFLWCTVMHRQLC